ncbi:unnamed protein product [Didymodactylos carnosus]|uniref:Retrotransposon gag domain-containing protein n=1 Tax=Didymodactylos carnosus TaxID=1234261 RepID=A0A814PFX8_9BILA|nr:unnamed protein product [Didymodactylos carnosus]CAF1576787.1 unnamed protein product [Didymodactylos carnosus]CAF3868052.1 unnamed protein product [Didymodactylos carnosus]CAF4374252.1 unnamed protein product [Didymodactylos carnosus]
MSNIADRTRSKANKLPDPNIEESHKILYPTTLKLLTDPLMNPDNTQPSINDNEPFQDDDQTTKQQTTSSIQHQQKFDLFSGNQSNSTTSLVDKHMNVATQLHIQHLLDSIVDFRGTRDEDIVTWLQRIELVFELADYVKFKWIKLTALHLRDQALQWYHIHKNEFSDWYIFKQMLIQQYDTPSKNSTTKGVDDFNYSATNNLFMAPTPFKLNEITITQQKSSTNLQPSAANILIKNYHREQS